MDDKIVFEGQLEFVPQWDLDHHEAALHVDGEMIVYELLEKLGVKKSEYGGYDNLGDVKLGRFRVTFEALPPENAPA